MPTSNNEEREKQVTKVYHSVSGLVNDQGVAITQTGDTIISGEDDRKDVYQLDENNETEAIQKRLAESTVILTNKDSLTEQADGTFHLAVSPFRRSFFPPCENEPFGNQHTGGWCSGFIVGPDVIVTAGHCGETDIEIQNTAYVFGFCVTSPEDAGTTVFNKDQVYFGKELIARDLSDTGDYAVVRVDRVITAPGAAPLPVRQTGSIGIGMNIGVIGYPSGLPVKIAFGDNTVVMKDQDPWLIANLDTYGGNSGSAVFNSEGQVEGILVRGARDYVIDQENGCFLSNRISNSEGSEAVTKASAWVEHIPGTE